MRQVFFLIAIGGVITSTRPGVVELRQQVFKPASHYRTEQRDRFDDPGPQPRNDTLVPSVTVHLGDDRPGYSLQSHAVHRKIPSEEQDGAKALRAAGSGILIPTAVFPKPVRCNPVTGGPRTPDVYDLGVANQVRHDRVSQKQFQHHSRGACAEPHLRRLHPTAAVCQPKGGGAGLAESQRKNAGNAGMLFHFAGDCLETFQWPF